MRGACFVTAVFVCAPLQAQESPEIYDFGKTSEGEKVQQYKLSNATCTVHLITLGATVQEWHVRGKGKEKVNIVLGFPNAPRYESEDNQFFGCTTGRVAGRIALGKFTLEGKEYKLAINNGRHHLHGGVKRSLDKVVWKAKYQRDKESNPGVHFSYTSPDGEEGYPGNLKSEVHYVLTKKNELRIEYTATTDKATPINLTNHSYFNLAGAGAETVLDHELEVEAEQYVPTDDELIPTGKLAAVKGTPLDFRKSTRLGERFADLAKGPFKGYDHTLVLSKREKTPTLAAVLKHPPSGRWLKVFTNQPALQVYTGNFLKGQKAVDGKIYKQHSAVCLETQHIPDSINQPAFPSVVLRPGETYRYTCVYAVGQE
jgi:aldose 1-epimerase